MPRLTCSPGLRSRKATTTSGVGEDVMVRGKTTAELGAHEWFMSAAKGETQTPIGDSEGVASVNEFVVNCVVVRVHVP